MHDVAAKWPHNVYPMKSPCAVLAPLGALTKDASRATGLTYTNRLDARECHCVVVFDRASGDAIRAHQDACFISTMGNRPGR